MSWLSKNVFDPLKSILGAALTTGTTSADPTISTAAQKVEEAGAAIVAALPAIAVAGANAALSVLGPTAVGFEGFTDEVIQLVAAELLSRHSNPTAAAASVSSTVQGAVAAKAA